MNNMKDNRFEMVVNLPDVLHLTNQKLRHTFQVQNQNQKFN
jgi:hypothetical protein